MPATDDLTLSYHDVEEAAPLLAQLCGVYADAYGVDTDCEKTSAFRTRALKALEHPRYELVTAHDSSQLVG